MATLLQTRRYLIGNLFVHTFFLRLVLALALLAAALFFNDHPAFAATAGATAPGNNLVYPFDAVMRQVGLATLNAGERRIQCAVIDPAAGYAYFGTDTAPAQVIKVRLSDCTRVATLTLEPGEDFLWSAAIDPAGGYAYFGTFFDTVHLGTAYPPGKVIKIRLADFTRVGTLTLNNDESGLMSAVIDPAAGFAYFGTFGVLNYPGKVVKIRLADFARVGAITFNYNSYERKLGSAVIDPAGGYAYFGTVTVPGNVIKIRLADFTRVGVLTLNNYQEGNLLSAAIDLAGGYAYFGCLNNSGASKLVKVRLADFTRAGETDLDSVKCMVIDPTGSNILTGTGLGVHYKVRLADMVCTGWLGWSGVSGGYYCAVLDPATGYAFFGGNGDPGSVRKVSLSCKGTLRSSRITLGEPGTVTGVRFYSHAALGNLRLAIYDDATTKTLLWQSASTPNTSAGAWVTVPIAAGTPAALKLAPGNYWLAWQTDSTGNVPSYVPATGNGFCLEWPYGAFPARLGAQETTSTQETWSEYITYDTPTAPPENPGVKAVASGSITWTWADRSANEAGFKIWADSGLTTPTTLRTTTAAGATSWTMPGLAPNTPYTCRIAATNAAGDSSSTACVTTWTLANKPVAPGLSSPTTGSLAVSVGAGDGNPAATDYALYCVSLSKWVQPGGMLGGAPAWRTAADWGRVTVGGLQPGTAYAFRARARNSLGAQTADGPAGSTTTAAIAPAITGQPVSCTVNPGQAVSFSVVATGTAPLKYQWKCNGAALVSTGGRVTGTATAKLTLNPVQAGDAGVYTCEVSNSGGQAISQSALLRVNPALTVISAHGVPTPAVGTTVYVSGTVVTARMAAMTVTDAAGTTRWILTGWTASGSAPASGAGASVSFTLTQPTTLTWQWKTQYKLMATADPSSRGSVKLGDGVTAANGTWHDAKAVLTLRAVPNAGSRFAFWWGALGGRTNPGRLTLEQPATAIAHFDRSGNGVEAWGLYGQ